MGFFSDAAREQAAGRAVRASWFVSFDFLSGDKHVWTGAGRRTIGGVTYEGAGELTALPGLRQLINGQASRAELGMSGVGADMVAAANAEVDEIMGREVSIALGFFDRAWQLIASPHVLWIGVMDQLKPDLSGGGDGQQQTASVAVSAGSIFVTRKRAPLTLYSDRQQRTRSDDDRSCERTALYRQSNKHWPNF